MIAIAKAVKVKKDADAVCLFDTVRCFIEEDGENIPISSFNQKVSKNINNMS